MMADQTRARPGRQGADQTRARPGRQGAEGDGGRYNRGVLPADRRRRGLGDARHRGRGARRARLEVVFKPLTTLLLLGVVGWPETTFARLVAAGIVLSVVGDVALLWPGQRRRS